MNRQGFKIDIKTGTDQRKLIGAIIMAVFAVVAIWRWYETHLIFFMLLAFRDVVVAYFIAVRANADAMSSWRGNVLAYTSSALPLLYFKASSSAQWMIGISSLMMIVGFLVATLATIELGSRMGVAPARRGKICLSGIYRYIRHPMYTGYVIAELGTVLLNPLNLLIFVPSVLGYYFRARLENQLFENDSKENI